MLLSLDAVCLTVSRRFQKKAHGLKLTMGTVSEVFFFVSDLLSGIQVRKLLVSLFYGHELLLFLQVRALFLQCIFLGFQS